MSVMSLLRAGRPNMAVAQMLSKQGEAQGQAIVRSLKTSVPKPGGHGPNTMQIIPSKYQWQKYKDQLHYYILLGVIPLSAIVFYANVFIGPATLCEIPEGYVPKQWEYYKHPISRFIARHCIPNQQEIYERNLHYISELDEKRRMRLLAWKVEKLMQERGDYPNYYTTKTYLSHYARNMKAERDYINSTTGEN